MAIVFADRERVEVREIRVPELREREVLVRSEVTGVSIGTDRWMLQGRYAGVTSRYPLVYGYLRVGRVEQVGPGVALLKPGDRVFAGLSGSRLDPADGCGEAGGAYSSLGVIHESDAVLVPDDVPVDVAALCGLAAVSIEGVQLSRVKAGDLVAVVGLGMIGQMAAQLCRARGARVVGSDLMASRREVALRCSVDRVIDPAAESLEQALTKIRAEMGPGDWGPPGTPESVYERARWEGAGGVADVVIDTTGVSGLFSRHIALLRRQGTLCLQGYFPDPITLDFHAAHLKRAHIVCPGGMDLEGYRESLALARAGRLTIAPLITHSLPAAQAAEAFDLVLKAPDRILGLVLTW